MNGEAVFGFALRWGLIGSLALTVYLVGAWQAGYLGAVRNESGELRRHVPLAGVLTGVGSLLMYVVLLVVADLRLVRTSGVPVPFSMLLMLDYLTYMFWLLFDTIIIDIVVVALWHPAFLRLPDPEAHGSAAYHLRTIPRGMIIGIVIAALSAGIAALILR